MNWDTATDIAAKLWNLATWRYLPITILFLVPLVVYYISRPYTVLIVREKDAETGSDKDVVYYNHRQAILLTCMVIAIPLSVWFFYLFLIAVGV
mgnify:CR=1 FL=1